MDRAKADGAYFAEHVIGFVPHAEQKQLLRAPHPSVVAAWGRGGGKTTAAAAYCLWKGYEDPGHVFIYVAGRQGQSDYAQSVLVNMCHEAKVDLRGVIASRSSEKLVFENGSVVYYLPNSSVAVRGFHNQWKRDGKRAPSITLIIDESAEVAEATYRAAFNVLNTAKNSKALFIGSPMGKDHWFYRQYVEGLEPNDKVLSIDLDATTVAHVDQDRNEEYRSMVDADTYDSEIRGRFVDSISSYFTREMVTAATREYEFPAPFDEDMQYCLGIDLSSSEKAGSDWTWLVVLGRKFGGVRDLAEQKHTGNVDVGGKWVRMVDGQVLGTYSKRKAFVDALERDEGPRVQVCAARRFQRLSGYELHQQMADLKRLYPSMENGIAETYEALVFDQICRSVKRRGENEPRSNPRNYGRGPLDLRMHVVAPTNPLQRQGFNNLHRMMLDGHVWLPATGTDRDSDDAARQLRKELLTLKKEITAQGNVRFEASRGSFDDGVYAMMWAAYELRRERYMGRCAA